MSISQSITGPNGLTVNAPHSLMICLYIFPTFIGQNISVRVEDLKPQGKKLQRFFNGMIDLNYFRVSFVILLFTS